MNTKHIEKIIPPPAPHMVGDGFRVHNFFPGGNISNRRMSPFFLLDYNAKIDFAPKDEPRGVGVHPHRGFETVTIAYHGSVAHHDSTGNSGVIGQGDVQWMTAGSGVLHKEYHEENYSKKGGPFQMVQLWVNLPAKHKMTTPKYQAISGNTIPKYALQENGGTIEVIAGEYKDIRGIASTFSPIHLYNVHLQPGTSADIRFSENYNTGLLVVQGSIIVNNSGNAPLDHFVLFENKGEEIQITATEESIVLVLSGEPINEPIAAYGPFLMNTHAELQQAYDDFNHGKFGYLE
ncbi:MAG: pirin family protein [Chitinophagaceae bacterium]|nr:pirin family protein [Chitinophagaceae bacterium]MCW5925753.1 pirin family protein [Chitinophagaceae bacterium]